MVSGAARLLKTSLIWESFPAHSLFWEETGNVAAIGPSSIDDVLLIL
jgi:hypothetical protein